MPTAKKDFTAGLPDILFLQYYCVIQKVWFWVVWKRSVGL